MAFTAKDSEFYFGDEGQVTLGPIYNHHDFKELYGDVNDPTFDTSLLDMQSTPQWRTNQQVEESYNWQKQAAENEQIMSEAPSIMDNMTPTELINYLNKPIIGSSSPQFYTNNNNPQTLDQKLGYLANQANAAIADTYGGIAGFLHADDTAKYFKDYSDARRDNNPIELNDDYSNMGDYISTKGLGHDFANLGGSMSALAPLGFAGAEFGAGSRALTALAERSPALARALSLGEAGLSKLPKNWQEGLKWGANYATTKAIPESMSEGGQVRLDLLENNPNHIDPTMASIETALLNYPLLVASDMIEGATLGRGAFNIPKKFITGLLGDSTAAKVATAPVRALPNMAFNGLSESTQEALQEAISAGAKGEDYGVLPWNWTDEQGKAFRSTLLPAALLGLAGGSAHATRNNNNKNTNNDINATGDILTSDAYKKQQEQLNNALLQNMQQNNVPMGNTPRGNAPQGTPVTNDAVESAVAPFLGVRMDNGANGCVEAVTKIGAKMGSPFLTEQLRNGVVYVPTLVKNAGDKVIPFDASKLEAGDIIVYGDDDHVVMYDGKGGYVGNSSSQQKVVHGSDYNSMDDLQPTKIIKTDTVGGGTPVSTGGVDISNRPGGHVAQLISERTGIPADWIWAQMAHETGNFSSDLAREDHNYGGIKETREGHQGVGELGYRHFDSDEEYADYAAKNLNAYTENGIKDAKTIEEFAKALKDGGYYEDSLENYTNGLKNALGGDSSVKGGNMSAVNAVDQMDDTAAVSMMDDFLGEVVTGGQLSQEAIAALTDSNGHFVNNAENRAALLDNNEDLFRQYLSDIANNSDNETKRNNARLLLDTMKTSQRQSDSIKKANSGIVNEIINNAGSKNKNIKGFYNDFIQDRISSIDDVNEINEISSMLNVKGNFQNTPENRKALAQKYKNEIADYYNNVYGPRHEAKAQQEPVKQAPTQPVQQVPVQQVQQPQQAQVPTVQNNTPMAQQSQEQNAQQEQVNYQAMGNRMLEMMKQRNIPHNAENLALAVNSGNSQLQALALRHMYNELANSGMDANELNNELTKANTPLLEEGGISNATESENGNTKEATATEGINTENKVQDSEPEQAEKTGEVSEDDIEAWGEKTRNALADIKDKCINGEITYLEFDEEREKIDNRLKNAIPENYSDEVKGRISDVISYTSSTVAEEVRDALAEKEAKETEAKTYDYDKKGKWKVISRAGDNVVARSTNWNKKTRKYENYEEADGQPEGGFQNEMDAWDYAKKLNEQEKTKGEESTKAVEEKTEQELMDEAVRKGEQIQKERIEKKLENLTEKERKQMLSEMHYQAVQFAKRELDNILRRLMEFGLTEEFIKNNRNQTTLVYHSLKEMVEKYDWEGIGIYLQNDRRFDEMLNQILEKYTTQKAKEKNEGEKVQDKSAQNEVEADTNVGGKTEPQESHFDTGTFTHTKTGKQIPQAKLKQREETSVFNQLRKLAKQYAGWYSNYSKSFLFETEAGRDAFIKAADEDVFGQEVQAPVTKHETEKAPAKEAKKENDYLIPDEYIGSVAESLYNFIEYKDLASPRTISNLEGDVFVSDDINDTKNAIKRMSNILNKAGYDSIKLIKAEVKRLEEKAASKAPKETPKQEKTETATTEENSKAEKKPKKESVFGDKAENDAAMLEALGINPDELSDDKILTAPEGIVNTAEERARLEKELMAELNKLSANPVFNPKIYSLGLQIGMTYVKDGINTAKKLVTKLKATFGDKIGPWAPAIAETISTWPKGVPFNEKAVMAISKAVGSRFEEGLTSLDEIQDSMKEVFKNRHKEFAPMIEASYNGIKKYFDMKEAENNEQRGESESTNAGHEGLESRGSKENEFEGTGGVSGQHGREGERHGSDNGQEHSNGSAASGVRAGTELETPASNGTDKRGNKSDVQMTEAEKHPSPTETPGHDYVIKDNAVDVNKKSEAVRFKQNIDAIKMLKQLEADDRMPTPSEQEVLAGYNGWGGLKGAFVPVNDKNREMNKELHEVLTDEEYEAAKSTINDAFYTSPKIIRAMWEGISRMGFKGGRILEPSMGIGNFFGAMPKDVRKKSSLHGIELDDLTSRFAKMLYPNAQIEHTGFQNAKAPDNFFDLVVSNIPFGQLTIDGYMIHNYFFANGMDKVRPGGLMMYITSQGSLAGSTDAAKMRTYLDGKADMIGAFKLPAGAFGEAGTSVSTDIVIFRKRDKNGEKSPHAQDFLNVKTQFSNYGSKLYDMNEYFVKHPENMIGTISPYGRDRFGKPALRLEMEGDIDDVAKALSEAMKTLPKNIYKPVSRNDSKVYNQKDADKKAAADENIRDFAYYLKGSEVYQNQNGEEVQITGKKNVEVLKDFIQLKHTLNALLTAERDPKATDDKIENVRKLLNKEYDSFVKKHGYLNDSKAARYFKDDPFAGFVQVLEKPIEETYTRTNKNGVVSTHKRILGVNKSDIFTKRTMQPKSEVTRVEKPDDALIASLTNKGYVDIDYMAGLMKTTPEKIIGDLKGKIFKNPASSDYETREEYLSGNVKEKLAQAEAAAKEDYSYVDNVEELKKVVPEDLVSSEIDVMMGAPWIPEADVQKYVDSVSKGSMTVYFNRLAGTWYVNGYGSSAKYKLDGIKLPTFIEKVLNNMPIKIFDGTGDKKTLNQQKTDAANLAADEMRRDFRDWLWTDKERENRLVKYYNDNFNTDVVRDYDGSHLTFPGMNGKIKMKPHQKNVVWRMLQGLNTLIAHCVGAGKTFEMQAAGMEMRRLGIANKPMYCLPNNVLEQFAREFRQLYPQAKILTLQSTDLPAVQKTVKMEKTEDGRRKKVDLLKGKTKAERDKILASRADRTRMLSRIRSEDWDAILISHTLFERFPLSPETTAQFIRDEINLLERTITEAKGAGNMSNTDLSNLVNAKKKLEDELEEALSASVDDIGISFEDLGIDQLFVDEADMFKNLGFHTKLGNIRGLNAKSKSNRARDMFAKTQWLTRTMGGRGVVFATGTPISNTMAEMYIMLRYLDSADLNKLGLDVFDNWIRTFGDIGQDVERKPTGDGFREVTKVKRFVNMTELKKLFRKIADIKTQDELDLNIPKLKNDKPTVVTLEPDPVIVNYIKNVVPARVAAMSKGFKKQKGEDNMLALTNDLRKLSLNEDKIEACADKIAKKYFETTDTKGTQLVFCDMGIPKAMSDKDKTEEEEDTDTFDVENPEVYKKLIEKLIDKGIPEKEIAFIQNYNTKKKRDAVFQRVYNGDVRVLVGSTETMGAGTNCQKHLVALHDLDAPWRPRDLEQRHGRILRQGNENKEVEIFNYVVKDSFDANMWEKLKNKAAIIAQAVNNDMSIRTLEDVELNTISYAEIEEAATGNPLIKERLNVNNALIKEKNANTAFKKKVYDAENVLDGHEKKIEEQEANIKKIEEDIANRQDTKGDNFSMTLNKKSFDKRNDAEQELNKVLADFKSRKAETIGNIGGFRLNAAFDGSKVVLQLVGKRAYNVQTNSITGIENALRSAPDNSLKGRKALLQEFKDKVEQAKEILTLKNPHEAKVKELDDRLHEIDRQIKESLTDKGEKQQPKNDVVTDPETGEILGSKPSFSVSEQNGPSDQRSTEEIKEDVLSALPNPVKVEDHGDTMTIHLPNDVTVDVEVVDNVSVTDEELEQARKEHGIGKDVNITVNGKFQVTGAKRALISLARNGKKGTAYHEIVHLAYELALTKEQKQGLNIVYGAQAKAAGKDIEEFVADKMRDDAVSKRKLPEGLKKAYDAINDMIDKLKRAILGQDTSAYKTMRDIETGKVFENSVDKSEKADDNVLKIRFDEVVKNEHLMSQIKPDMKPNEVRELLLSPFRFYVSHLGQLYDLAKEKRLVNKTELQKRKDIIKKYLDVLYAARKEFNYGTESLEIILKSLRSRNTIGETSSVYRALQSLRDRNAARGEGTFTDGEELPVLGEYEFKSKVIKELEKEHSNKGAFSIGKTSLSISPEQEQAPQSFLEKAFKSFAKNSNIKGDKIIVEQQDKDGEKEEVNLKNYIFSSPSRIAEKVGAFKYFYTIGKRAMDVLTQKRTDFERKLNKAFDLVKNEEDYKTLNDLLISGDVQGKEWTKAELIADGVKENVAEAYSQIRHLMEKAYKMVNEARRRPQIHTINNATEKQIQDLRDNDFVDILNIKEDDKGHRKVTYKEYANWERTYTVNKKALRKYNDDPAIQVLDIKQDGDDSFTVTVRESIPPVNKLTGYIPHFFHNYMVRIVDKDGGYVDTIDSGRTEREAVQKAEEWLKSNQLEDGQTIHISPKIADFTSLGMDENQYAAVMGDKDYYRMMNNIAKQNDLTFQEAKEMLNGSVRQKNRHRFFGNLMQRKGVNGYEKNMGYILRHYFNSASRYYAMETEFKPKAINMYERLYGDFDKEAPNTTADYTRDYINDINGNPTTLEKAINNALNKSSIFRKFVASNFGDRAALQMANNITSATSYLCLGYLNASSALLNLTQLINTAAYLNDFEALGKGLAKGFHHRYNLKDLRVLHETNVLNDIGLDSGSGYDMNRMGAKGLLGKLNKGGMVLFKKTEAYCRCATVLAAYESAIKKGKSHNEAIEYAKEINQKSNFDYGVADAPNIFRRGSILSQLMLQFKKYGIKELEVMGDMLPWNKATNGKQKAIFWGLMLLACGLLQWPGEDFLDNVFFDGKLKPKMKAWMMEAAGDSPMGKSLAKAAMYGLAAPITGVDISNRAGLADVIPSRGRDIGGPSITRTVSLVSDLFQGKWADAIRDVSPGLYNQYAAWIAGQSTGTRDRVNNYYDSFYDKALRSMGFKSVDESIDSDIQRITSIRKKEATEEKQRAIDDYIEDPSTENYRRLVELGVKPKTVQEERKKKKMDRLERIQSGMSKNDKKGNSGLIQFAE